MIYDYATLKCVCPTVAPYWDGAYCVSCTPPKVWNEQLTQCEQCPFYQIYDSTMNVCQSCPADRPLVQNGQCVACPTGTKFDPTTHTCLQSCVANQFFNKTTQRCECPATEPYFREHCFNCYGDKHYDPTLNDCVYCDIGKTWNASLGVCQ